MIVSFNWLKDYVDLDMPPEELERRLMMAGLNHEGTEQVADDLAIDLEVTSNRPDCLGHLGIAREVAVLWQRELKIPAAAPVEAPTPVAERTHVQLECPDLCYRYTARVVGGVNVGPSPAWLTKRLTTLGLAAVNNVVDITNYVLMECGQPLHAFDLAKLAERRIVVRRALPGETLEAIDHKVYEPGPDACVIADAARAVAIGGVMGGAATEVSSATKELLIETAEFAPRSIRDTARRLNLHSESSYRFERGIDPEGVDWASRRACELILDVCGGWLAAGVIDVGRRPPRRPPIVLRWSQLPRILGIEIPPERARQILTALGNRQVRTNQQQLEVIPPSWRRDLTREIDLVEEVGRIHGYEAISENVSVPMAPSAQSDFDRVLQDMRHVLTATGYDEALTESVIDQGTSQAFSPWTSAEPLVCQIPVLRGADRLRRSLVPSLLATRRKNEALGNPYIELFEIARVYLSRPNQLPLESLLLGVTSGGDFLAVKGMLEALVAELNPAAAIEVRPAKLDLLADARACELLLGEKLFGYLGEVSAEGLERFGLRGPTTVAEVEVQRLVEIADLVPQYTELSSYPAISRDINLVVDENVRWAAVADTVRATGGKLLEQLQLKDVYRDAERLGAGKKSLLMTLELRWDEGTLTNQQADQVRSQIVEACQNAHGAQLRA